MQLRQFNELEAARRAVTFLTTTPLAPPLAAMAASYQQQVTQLSTTISQIDAQASAQTSAAGTITDKTSAAKVAATELRSGHLVPIKKVAKLLTKGSTGSGLSPNFASAITIPHTYNYQALLAAASATVQNVTPYKDLFTARGLPSDFLDQLTAQATALSQAISASGTAKTTRVASTVDIAQLMHELRSTMQVLDIGVVKACKADRTNGPTTLAGWKAAKLVRRGPTVTDIPFAPPASGTTGTSSQGALTASSAPSATAFATPSAAPALAATSSASTSGNSKTDAAASGDGH